MNKREAFEIIDALRREVENLYTDWEYVNELTNRLSGIAEKEIGEDEPV